MAARNALAANAAPHAEQPQWVKVARVTGGHHIFVRQGSNLRITVPVHANRHLKLAVQGATMKLAGISEDEL